MPNIAGHELSLPIISGEFKDKGNINVHAVEGTAFPIGEGIYLTAGHVMENAINHEVVVLASDENRESWSPIQIQKHEINSTKDVAILYTKYSNKKSFPWETETVQTLTDIESVGFPHALDTDLSSIHRKGFKGYIVTNRPYVRLPDNPQIYELSIPCPKGMSGSFILNSKTGKICGHVIGSDKSSIDLHYETESRTEQLRKETHRVTETSTYGIALTSKAILDTHFEILGGTLRRHLKENSLID